MRKWFKSKFASSSEQADNAIHAVSTKVDEVETNILQEVAHLEEERELHKRLLKKSIVNGDQKDVIMRGTRNVTTLTKRITLKRNLLTNMHREKQQLATASMNTSVARVMRDSLSAQKMLANANCSNSEIDDVLDDVDDFRQDTDDLSLRLGTINEDVPLDGQEGDIFDAREVAAALGMDYSDTDSFALDELQGIVCEGERHRGVPEPIPFAPIFPSVPRHEERQRVLPGWKF